MRLEGIPSQVVESGIKYGATDVAAKLIELDQTMIRFSNNEVTVSKNFLETIIDIFVMVEKRRAGSTTGLLPAKDLERTVRKLVERAKMSRPADVYAPLPRGPFKYDPSLLEPSKAPSEPDRLISYVKEAINGASESGAKRVAGSLIATNSRTALETSGQVSVVEEGSNIEISIRAFVTEMASGHAVSIAQDERGFQPAEAGKRAGEVARLALNPEQGQPGRFTALLGPMVFADLINQMGVQSSAFMVDAGQSFLTDRIGSRVASDKFTLTDDPTLKDTYGAGAFDDEGVPTRRNVIVRNGILNSYLHNSTTAKKFETETTANAGLIVPTPWNLVVEPGSSTFQDMLSRIDRGIYVTNDWYLRYQDYRRGDFSAIPRDGIFLIERGQIVKPIRDLRISDNMIRIFQNIREMSRERHWVKWWEVSIPTLSPYAVVEDMNFTKSTL